MRTYVRGPNSDTWHWCTNCTKYPDTIEDSVTLPFGELPSGGELDNQCLAKDRSGECRIMLGRRPD